MYTIEIFLAILAIDGIVSAYALIDKGAAFYKDIAAWVVSCVLSVYLANVAVSGTVQYFTMQIQNITVQNLTENVTNTIYTYHNPYLLQDDGLMWIFYILAICQAILGALAILDAVENHLANKSDKENLIQ